MTNVRPFALIVWLGLAGCSSSTNSRALLAGSWRTIAIPSGSGIDLSLTTAGPLVTGTGHEYNLMYLADTLKVRGSQQVDGTFRFDVTFGSGATATYSGRVDGQDQLDGTWTDAGYSPHALIFYRQIQ